MAIGTCTVAQGTSQSPVIICPYRLLERHQVFTDCLHLLTNHEPGNELHIVPEIAIPGGNVDYFLASAKEGKVCDFVGLEIQTLDSTGTVWPERQRFLKSVGINTASADTGSRKPFGMNWKMTAKTTLVQMHHKVQTFEHMGKHLVLAIQDCLLKYMRSEFCFGHLNSAKLGDPMHFHSYRLRSNHDSFKLALDQRLSTDSAGISKCLGLQADARVELEQVIKQLEARISQDTVFALK